VNVLRIFIAAGCIAAFALACNDNEPSDDNGNQPDVQEQDTQTPDVQPDEGQPEDTTTSNGCLSCLAAGQTYLFRKLDVTEPSTPMELPNLLNGIWAPDIVDYRLNIMMRVEEVTAQEDGGVLVKATAGSAWHNLPFDDIVGIEHGLVPDSFFFNVMEYTSTVYLDVDAQCNFETVNSPVDGSVPYLNFRPGPVDRWLICSGGNEALDLPKNTVPIRMLHAAGRFNDTCTGMTDGELAGCISKDAACEICDFLTAPDYSLWDSVAPDPSVTPVVCEASYCEHHCGGMPWTNFGGVVVGFGVPLNCDMNGDSVNEGFALKGSFFTETVAYADPE